MKKFKNHVRWDFRIALDGNGKNCRDALRDALTRGLQNLEDGTLDVELIENHEVMHIDETDTTEEWEKEVRSYTKELRKS